MFMGKRQFLIRLLGLIVSLCVAGLCAARAQGDTRLFLAGTEPPNADMTYVELIWLPDERGIAPGLTRVLAMDERIPRVMRICAKRQDLELKIAEADSFYGGFALRLGFDSADTAAFSGLLSCLLRGVPKLESQDELFLRNRQAYQDEHFRTIPYALDLMAQLGYGLAWQELAAAVVRPSELVNLTLEEYRNAWPFLFEASDLYAIVVAPTGVEDLLVAIDEHVDKDYGRPDRAFLFERPSLAITPFEGLGIKDQTLGQTIFQVNRVFVPSLVASVAEVRLFTLILDQRLDEFREAEGLDPVNDLFAGKPDEAEVAAGEAAGEDPPASPPRSKGLSGIGVSFSADGKSVSSFFFLSAYEGSYPAVPTLDRQIATLEQAMTAPFTEGEFAEALTVLRETDCAVEPTQDMAQSHGIWLREDLLNGRVRTFLTEDLKGCQSLTLDRVNEVREQTLTNSTTVLFAVGSFQEDAETLARPFCLVKDVGQLELACNTSGYQI